MTDFRSARGERREGCRSYDGVARVTAYHIMYCRRKKCFKIGFTAHEGLSLQNGHYFSVSSSRVYRAMRGYVCVRKLFYIFFCCCTRFVCVGACRTNGESTGAPLHLQQHRTYLYEYYIILYVDYILYYVPGTSNKIVLPVKFT